MNFTSLIRHESREAPGVSFGVRRMTEGTRLKLRLDLAAAFGRLRALESERVDLLDRAAERLRKPADQVLVGELLASERRELAELVEREALIQQTEINPAYLAAGIAWIEGLTLDGEAITDAAGLARVPCPRLYREILDAVLAASGLEDADRPNSGSPSTSGAVEGGETAVTTAPGASASSNTASITAPAA